MERRKFLKRLAIGSVAVAITPAIIAEATKPKILDWESEYQKCISSKEYFYRNYWMAVDPAMPKRTGYIFTVGTAGEDDPGSFKWIEPYQITSIKARRKGYGIHLSEFYDGTRMWPELK